MVEVGDALGWGGKDTALGVITAGDSEVGSLGSTLVLCSYQSLDLWGSRGGRVWGRKLGSVSLALGREELGLEP